MERQEKRQWVVEMRFPSGRRLEFDVEAKTAGNAIDQAKAKLKAMSDPPKGSWNSIEARQR